MASRSPRDDCFHVDDAGRVAARRGIIPTRSKVSRCPHHRDSRHSFILHNLATFHLHELMLTLNYLGDEGNRLIDPGQLLEASMS